LVPGWASGKPLVDGRSGAGAQPRLGDEPVAPFAVLERNGDFGPTTYHSGVAHPQMFDDDDPYLARVRGLAANLPDSAEKISHGRPAFHTVKVFAYYGGSLKQAGEWEQHPHSVVVQPDPSDRRALLEEPRTYVPAYLGPSGWVGVDLDTTTDWTEIAELLDASYRLTAPKRSIVLLDAQA
jgi:predicted DNA-binding protein (MmcQ/YjbR family)